MYPCIDVHGELNFDSSNLRVLHGLMNRLGRYLRQGDATKLAGLDVLLLYHAKGHAHRDFWVAAAELENVNLFAALQLRNGIIQTATSILRRAIDLVRRWVDAALDVDEHLLRILGIFLEVFLQQHQGVVVGRAIELSAVPAVA